MGYGVRVRFMGLDLNTRLPELGSDFCFEDYVRGQSC